jgi:hypothetical protein
MYRNIFTIPSFSACLSSNSDELYLFADEYFSDVKNDTVSVWEDESVSFDVLSNDRIAGSKVEIANSSSVS